MTTQRAAAGSLAELLRGWQDSADGMKGDGGYQSGRIGQLKLCIDALTPHIQREQEMREFVTQIERSCPCGHRPESPKTHPHAPGCPVEALAAILGDKP